MVASLALTAAAAAARSHDTGHDNKTRSITGLTLGGGIPPAPGGQSGSITVRWGVLHWHEGEGSARVVLARMSITDWSTCGVNQSDDWGTHGRFLKGNVAEKINKYSEK